MNDKPLNFYVESFASNDQYDEYIGMIEEMNYVLRINSSNSTFCIDNLAREKDSQMTVYGYLLITSENSKSGVMIYSTDPDTDDNELYGRFEKISGQEDNFEFTFKDNQVLFDLKGVRCEFELSK